MAGLWQRTGTVTVTNGSKTVAGLNTKWKTGTLPIQKGHTFYGPDNWAYEVDTVVSDTEILLVENYRGGTLANQAYRIDITRTSTISQFAADLASLVGKYRAWFDGMMTWLTGSGDVSILNPDTGANVTIPSWTKVASEGEGQAARAKTEADKAAASAALAGDIVVASALPLPDVWVPLSNSLRMITGYGREVKVGEDVVSQMVNFSRSTTATYIGKDGLLKTAAVNEPRFEKEGLLIEGQSTNLITGSAAPSSTNGYSTDPTPIADPLGGSAAKVFTVSNVSGSYVRFNNSMAAPATDVKTSSVWVRAIGQSLTVTLDCEDIASRDYNLPADAWVRISTTRTVSTTTYSNFFDVTIKNPVIGQKIAVWGGQLETLPFASSYIPTNGAAVTRGGDKAWIQTAGNIAVAPFTVAMEVNFRGLNSTGRYARLFTCGPGCYAFFTDIAMAGRFNASSAVSSFSLNPIGRAVSGMVFNGETAKLFSAKKLGAATPITALSAADVSGDLTLGSTPTISPSDTLYGHVRNVRIWHSALTDEQIKAFK